MKFNQMLESTASSELQHLRAHVTALTTELEFAKLELVQRYEQLQSVYYWAATTDIVSRAQTIEEIFSATITGLQQVFDTEQLEISLFDEAGVSRFKVWQNLSENYIDLMTGYSPWLADTPSLSAILIDNIKNYSGNIHITQNLTSILNNEGIESLAWIPILQQGQLIGRLGIYYKNLHKFDDATINLAQTIANYIVFAIERKQAELQLQQTMQQLQQTQMQLIQSEKMSSLGQLVAGVAHEINNPVSFIFGNLIHAKEYTQNLLQLLNLYKKYYPHPAKEIKEFALDTEVEFLLLDLPEALKSMEIGAERIKNIVTSLRNFSRLDEAEIKYVDIHEGIDSTLLLLEHRLKIQSNRSGGRLAIEVIKEYGNVPLIECYPGQLNQVFINILTNAIDAFDNFISPSHINHKPQIRIRTEFNKNNRAKISIIDNGSGIPEETQKRIFEPFFTTKPVGKGTGMGLAISHQIIAQRHGGSLECISELEKYTEFVIIIPLKQNFDPPNPP